jgi:large subunit ribosomal protein L35
MKKNKIKTRKSVSKRFKVTKSGKVLRRGAQNRHLKANRTKRNARRGKVPKEITNKMAGKIKKMLGK